MSDDHNTFDAALDDLRLALNTDDDQEVIAVAVGALHDAMKDGVRVQRNVDYAAEMSRMAIWAASVALGSRAKVEVGEDGEPRFIGTGDPVPEAPTLYFAKPGMTLQAEESGTRH